MGKDDARSISEAGMNLIGNAPWGSHICMFYQSREDLIEVLAPYFAAGLSNNEFCMCVASEPFPAEDVKVQLSRAIPGFYGYLERGQIEIVPHSEWYDIDGVFDCNRVLNGWLDKLEQAKARGFTGLRLTGNIFWLDTSRWNDFIGYEQMIDDRIGEEKIIALCTYSLDKCDANDILDVSSAHRYVLSKRGDEWQVFENRVLKKTREALVESEGRFEALVSNSPATIVVTDVKGNIEYVNPKFTQLTGYTLDEAKGKNPRVLKSGHTSPEVYKRLWETVLSGDEWRGEFLNVKKNGELYWESAVISSLRDAEGNITNLIAIKEDITERKRAEEALRVSNDRLTIAQKAGGIGVFDWNLETNRLVMTLEMEAIFGIPHGQFNNTFEDLSKRVYSEDLCRFEQHIRGWMESGYDYGEAEYRILRNGELRWITSRVRIFYSQECIPLRMIGTSQDITERKRSEETLRRQAMLIDLSPDAIFVRSIDGTITFWSSGAETLYGWKKAEASGKSSYDLLKKQLPQPLEEINQQLRKTGLWSGEVIQTAMDGRKIVVQSRWKAQFDREGNIGEVMESNVDITERKRLEEALKDRERRLKTRLNAILTPEVEAGETLKEITDLEALQSLADTFSSLTGVCSAIVDLEGRILVGSGWQDICTKFHRCNPETLKNCIESDLHLSGSVAEGKYAMYKCKNGMWDIVTPIVVNGKHMANLYTGQFFFEDETLDYEFFRQQARRYGFDEKAYLDALDRTPRHSRDKVYRAMGFYTKFAGLISQLSFSNVQLARLTIAQQRMEQELRESENRLHALADNIPNLAWMANADGWIFWYNKQWYEYTGTTLEEMQGWGWQKVHHPDYVQAVTAEWSVCITEGKPYDNVFPLRGKDGDYRWFLTRITPIRDEQGKIQRWFGTNTDITERKQMEEALRESKAKLETVIASMTDAVFVSDTEGNFVDFNNAFATYHKFRNKEECYKKLAEYPDYIDVLFPDGTPAPLDMWAVPRALRGETMINEEYILRRKDTGETWWGSYSFGPIRDGGGRITGSVVVSRDITERKWAEEALRDSEERLRNMIEASPVPMVAFEGEQIRVVNRKFTETFGYTIEDIPSLDHWWPLAYPDAEYRQFVVRRWTASIEPAIRDRTSTEPREVVVRCKDGTEKEILSYFSSIGDLNLSVFYDLTERKQAEKDLAESKMQAELYVDIMGHDINNLNQIALMNLEMVKDEPGVSDELLDYVETSYRAVQSSSILIENVRKLQKITEGKLEKETVDLNEIIIDCAREAPCPAGKKVKINYAPSNEMPVIGAPLMKEIFCNLICNSIKYSDADVAIDIQASETIQNGRKYYQIAISDNGYGIPDEVKPKIFTRFHRGTKKAHGKGLGLYIVRTLLEKFGGSVTVDDRVPGDNAQGSRFTVALPAQS